MKIKNIIIAEKKSDPCWMNGAYVLCFVYSNKGNLLIKGYSGDVELELTKLKSKGYKFFYNKRFYGGGTSRGFWGFYSDDVLVLEPSRPRKGEQINSFIIGKTSTERNKRLHFKRLPKRWIKEFEEL